jgi:predicted signal transduction protein with EAL and GGDEF domain
MAMSMYRQLWLAMLASMFIALGASLFASLMNARAYLEAQLAMKNQDNATNLALSLNRPDTDVDDVVLAVTALYDSGHYEFIQVISPDGKPLVEKVHAMDDLGAPVWFTRLLPLSAAPGQAEITSGWNRLGTMTLLSRAQFAYKSLWRTALTMTGATLAAAILGGILVSLVLSRLRAPMRSVIEQARAINEHRFVTIPEPNVPELRELASAMNDTVGRLKARFEEDARAYESLRRAANYDPLTGLANRAFFLASLEHALETEDTMYGGLAIVRVGRLGRINRDHGRAATDDLLVRVGLALVDLTTRCVGSFAGRLNGADFAILLPAGCDNRGPLGELLNELLRATEPTTGGDCQIYIGFGDFRRGDNPSRLMARIDAAVASAEMGGVSTVAEALAARADTLPDTAEAWRSALRQALRRDDALKLVHHPLRLATAGAPHLECPLRLRLDQDGEWLTASNFLPYAERLGLVQELDMATLNLALLELEANASLGGLWVNLSASSIADPEFQRRLGNLLEAHPDGRARLWVEVPEASGLRRLAALRALTRALKPLGVRVGLEHYGHHFNQIGLLYDLGLDFLKIDRGFIHDIDKNPGNQAFLKGLCDIAHHIGIQIIAEGVEDEAEVATLAQIGFDGVTGMAVHES